MLRTNLATRPFYNDRGIRLAIAVAVVLVVALTAFNALQILSLNRRHDDLSERADKAEAATAQLREQARVTIAASDQREIAAVQAAAREANELIDRRAFSWTDLFNRFEETLPPDVRIASVQPQVDDEGRMLVAVTLLARRTEDLYAFLDQLESTGAFSDVISRQESTTEEGLLRSVVQGYYGPTGPATISAPATSDSVGAPGNQSNGSPRGAALPAANGSSSATSPAPRSPR